MNYYILLNDTVAQGVREATLLDNLPRKDLNILARRLNATFIEQKSYPIKPIDKVCAQLSSTDENWAFARTIASELTEDDVIFCPEEKTGIPFAAVCNYKIKRPKIIVWFHRITGLKSRLALKVFNVTNTVDAAIVSSYPNKKFLEDYLHFEPEKVLFWRHPIDCDYFNPQIENNNLRPLIVSVGLEQRDYRPLASVTKNLNVDVKVAGFSQFQSRVAKTFPKILPPNMTNQRYPWSELVQLYYDADLVVIPLKENKTAAGITVLLEAMACKKAIICVKTQGLADYLIDESAIWAVNPGDTDGLRKAILYLLSNPQQAKKRAEKAYQLVWEKHNLDSQVKILADFFKTI